MNNKYLKLQSFVREAVDHIKNNNKNFNEFLYTAAHNYRLSLQNMLAVYAQMPDSTALLTYDQWRNIYGRGVYKRPKQILMFDKNNRDGYSVNYDYKSTYRLKNNNTNKSVLFFEYDAGSSEVISVVKSLYNDKTSQSVEETIYYAMNDVFSQHKTPSAITKLYTNILTQMLLSRFSGKELNDLEFLPANGFTEDELYSLLNACIPVFRNEFKRLNSALIKLNTLENKNENISIINAEDTVTPKSPPTDETNYTTDNNIKKPYALTQSEIDEIVLLNAFSANKRRIIELFKSNSSVAERTALLREEYGYGFRATHYINGCPYDIAVTEEGITVNSDIIITFNELAIRIDNLIKENNYYSEENNENYSNAQLNYFIGDTVVINNNDFIITDITDSEVYITDKHSELISFRYDINTFNTIVKQNHKENKSIISDIDRKMDKVSTQETSIKSKDIAASELSEAMEVYNAPVVYICYSEHPALKSFVNNKTPLPFAKANYMLGKIDNIEHPKKIGYFKTDFSIHFSTNGKELQIYDGRYDLGDGKIDLLNHINDYIKSVREIEHIDEAELSERQAIVDYLSKYTKISDSEKKEIDDISNRDYGIFPYNERYKITVASDVFPEHSTAYKIWDNEKDMYYTNADGTVQTFESAVSAERFINNELSKSVDKTNDFHKTKYDISIVGKTFDYQKTTFRISDINEATGSVALDDISSLEKGMLPIGTVLHYDTVIKLLNAQSYIKSTDNDYRIINNNLGVGTPNQRFNNNISAITLLKKIINENRTATSKEQEILAQYVGWGGLSNSFNKSSLKDNQLRKLLSPAEYESASLSTNTAFYTPPVVINAMYKAITNFGFYKGKILDPACGIGNFFGLIPNDIDKDNSQIFGVEIDTLSGQIAKLLYPSANITINGYENTNIPDNYIDVAVGNVPFANFGVSDPLYNKYSLKLHDYFFIKTLDKVRPGGIVAFITSKGTMDKQNSKVRKMIADKAELLGAIRLPNDTFKSAAGTEVTSDILFLQKRTIPLDLSAMPEWTEVTTRDGITMNKYYFNHPEMICGHMKLQVGQHGYDAQCVIGDDDDFSVLLNKAVEKISGKYIPYESFEETTLENTVIADENARNYSYFISSEGSIYYRENGVMTEKSFNGFKEKAAIEMIRLADTLHSLIDAEVENNSDELVNSLRTELNEKYDRFYNKYGSINSKKNEFFRDDNSYLLLCALEKTTIDENEVEHCEKADIFFERTISPSEEITFAESPEEALIISMSKKGNVDIEYMAELTGTSKEMIISSLVGSHIFLKPYEGEYCIAEEYLSGNVKEKLKTAKTAAVDDDKYAINVEALEKVIPQDVDATDIYCSLGTTWIPVDIYQEFMEETFKLPRSSSVKIEYLEYNDSYNISGKTSIYTDYFELTEKFGTPDRNALHILEDCLKLKDSIIKDTYYDYAKKMNVTSINHQKTALAQAKQNILKAEFKNWIFKDPERRRKLTRIYNDKFNCIVNRTYDGSHLKFPGANKNIELREHQKNAVARVLYGGNTLLAHKVGAGKSFEMIASAMKLKELGLCHKSLIAVPNHITEQMGKEFLRLYPSANILVAREKDFTKQNRKKLLTRIATGNFDAIIIGHTQLSKLPLKPETQIRMLNEQLAEIVDNLQKADENNYAKFTTKSLASAKKSIEKKLKDLSSKINHDTEITFEELGVDQLFIDEADVFKNLYIYTKMSNVSGIGSSESARASDLFTKIKYLQEINPNRGVVFATGTPISNSMSEMFTMQRYLQPLTLKKMGLYNFDSWATTFGEVVTSYELAVEGNHYQTKQRFSKFINVPELMSVFKEIADIQTAKTLKLPTPKVIRKTIDVEPTEQQTDLINWISDRADAIRARRVSPQEDNMLCICSDGKKIALDPRVFDESLDNGHKINACINNVYDIYMTNPNKTQVICCDLSTPSSDGWNIYKEIKDELVAKGVSENEIAFIQSAKSSKEKQKIFSDVSNGKIKILLGSTSTMGTGTNIQRKLIALHHLDCPNRPRDLEQREGRIERQGNENECVYIYNYITKGTFDAYMYQMVERKQRFVSEIMNSNMITGRVCDDVDETILNYGEIKAIASGNPLIQQKFQIDSEIAKLEILRNSFINSHHRIEDDVQVNYPKEISRLQKNIQCYKQDIEFANAHPMSTDTFIIEIEGIKYSKSHDAVEALGVCMKKINDKNLHSVGTYRGFKLLMFREFGDNANNIAHISIKNILAYRVQFDPTKGIGNITRINNAINESINKQLNAAESQLSIVQHNLLSAQADLNKSFEHESEYQRLLKEQSIIDAKLNSDTPNSCVEKPNDQDGTITQNLSRKAFHK